MTSLASQNPKKKQKIIKARGSAICTLSQKLSILEDEEVPAREVLIRTGDRTKKSGRSAHFWDTFKEQWWYDVPHNLYHWYGEHLRVPGNAHVTGNPHSYDAEACSRAIAVHAIKKCWFAKSLMTKDEATTLKAEMEAMNLEDGSEDKVARAQKASSFVSSLSSTKCTAFIKVHERFTMWCELGTFAEVGERGDPHFITEMIMGGIKWEKFPEDVDPKVAELETAAAEGLEEGAIPKEFTLQNAVRKGYVEYDSRGKISYTSAFLLLIPKEQMEIWTEAENAKRAEQSNWWNAHAWFEHLGGIVSKEMKKVKECHEARNPRFVSITKARTMLDSKNFGILEHVLAQEIE
jgi:hypothetical protein